MKCIIVEDQPPAQRILTRYISEMKSLQLVGTFSDAIQAMEYLRSTSVDLIFLDVHLPKMSGMDFLRMQAKSPSVILTTAFPEYALESYEFDVADYLLKPFSFQRFVKAVSKVPAHPGRSPESPGTGPLPPEPEEIFVKSGYEMIRVAIMDIVYIKSDRDYTELHLAGKKLLSSDPLRYWQDRLDAHQFVRIHKSYVLNFSCIEKISGNLVRLDDGTDLPIGRAYKEGFLARLNLK